MTFLGIRQKIVRSSDEIPTNFFFPTKRYQRTGSSEIRRNRSIPTNFRRFRPSESPCFLVVIRPTPSGVLNDVSKRIKVLFFFERSSSSSIGHLLLLTLQGWKLSSSSRCPCIQIFTARSSSSSSSSHRSGLKPLDSFIFFFSPLNPKPLDSIMDWDRSKMKSPEELTSIGRHFVIPLWRGIGYITMSAQGRGIFFCIDYRPESLSETGATSTKHSLPNTIFHFTVGKSIALVRIDLDRNWI
ncbi:hypothetical protein F2Q69_00020908 [Brassica cretica]|uniref:Uncharacterized protein n=1 Tax=Brassica cretica TaxID=69181 RepID=A0A8S9Q9N8_BRACR|nr:hypothetical protein F2Q69_00020908 [Brassica cretica]